MRRLQWVAQTLALNIVPRPTRLRCVQLFRQVAALGITVVFLDRSLIVV